MSPAPSERASLIEILLKLTRTAERLRPFTRDPDLSEVAARALLRAATEAREVLAAMIDDLWKQAKKND